MSLTRRTLLRGSAALFTTTGLVSQTSLASITPPPPADNLINGHPEIFIGSNEYPDGPGETARRAVAGIIPRSGRYLDALTNDLVKVFAESEGIPANHVAAFAGSFAPLNLSTLAFTSPEAGLVAADPTFSAGFRPTKANGAPTFLAPLRKDYTHDTQAMLHLAHDNHAGLIYVCNPNNPTGTITAREDILQLIDNKPQGSIVLVDEAYIHFSDEKSVVDQVIAGKDVVVLRSFSKIYGLAGLRLGIAVARPDLLGKFQQFGFNPLPVTSVVAGIASLQDRHLVPHRKAETAKNRIALKQWFASKGYDTSPSDASFFLVDVKRPGDDFIAALKTRGVHVGRPASQYPNTFRITLGSTDELSIFKREFEAVEAALA